MLDRARLLARWRVKRIIRILLIATVAAPLGGYLLFWAMVVCWPYPSGVDFVSPAATWIEDRDGTPLAAFVASDGQWRMPLSQQQISPHVINAIIATEDSRFYQHAGVDWIAVAAAGWQDLRSLSTKRGASTITMQLHRLRDPLRRSWLGKLEQAVRAAQIERYQTKQGILIEYLNRAPFGGNLVGVGAASWRYFGRPCTELSLGQASLLAGLPKNPNHYRPDRFPERSLARRRHVLGRMLACGLIDAVEFAAANQEPLDTSWRPLPQVHQDNATAEGSLPSLLSLVGRVQHGSIRTTLQVAVQRQAFVAAREQLDLLAASGITDAAVVVMDNPTGEVLASVSVSKDAPTLDLTRRARSTGSIIKPLLYAAAFEAGVCTPSSMLRDSPAAWPGYMPGNYDHGFRGSIVAAEALAESRNIPALQVLSRLGAVRGATVCGTLGLKHLARNPERYGLSLAIGGAEATPLEMAEAFATLARGGRYLPARLFRDPTIADAQSPSNRVLMERACWQTIAAISDPRRTARVFREACPMRAAWKTGTSSGHRDAWCAAATPARTVIVWMGNVHGRGSRSLVGAEAAAPLALRLAASLHVDGSFWPSEVTAGVAAPDAGALHQPLLRSRLTILSPVDGAEILWNSDLAADAQQLLLRAVLTNGPDNTLAQSARLWWFIDNQLVAATCGESQTWWLPIKGEHGLRVIDEQGNSAQVRFQVR